MTRTLNIVTKAAQFVPIITLASSFIVNGSVDLDQAGTLFLLSGAGALVINAVLVYRKVLLNPILLAANIWLLIGACAFGIPVQTLATLLSETNAVLLFAVVFVLGVIVTFARPSTGFIGMHGVAAGTVRRLSLIMLGLAGVALVWSIIFKNNIRLGGGLPFIVLNVTRRILIRRATR